MRNIAIVSPSGKFYGSEQVLFDFLASTKNKYTVYLPEGIFYDKLKVQGRHGLHKYTSVKCLYAYLYLMLIFKRYNGVYINEGGHIKYLNFLADSFPQKHFFAHIRLLEDCEAKRLGSGRKNISYIAVSDYIAKEIMDNAFIKCKTIYDIYQPISGIDGIRNLNLENSICRLGIIGRVTTTKGLHYIWHFCEYCEKKTLPFQLEFNFYGGVDEYIPEVTSFIERTKSYKNIICNFHGFVCDKAHIYNSIDVLLHFNKVEAWGRILMEALDFGIPFITFNAGGAGELSQKFGVTEYLVSNVENWENALLKQIALLFSDKEKTIECFCNAKEKMKVLSAPDIYTNQIEALFNE